MYTTYQVADIIDETKTVDELRKWASIHGVYKTNGYEWDDDDLEELFKEYNFRDRLKFKTEHDIELNDGEKENLVLCYAGKYANTYNIDLEKYIEFVDQDEQIDIKRDNDINLSEEDFEYIIDYDLDFSTEEKILIIGDSLNIEFPKDKRKEFDYKKYLEYIDPLEVFELKEKIFELKLTTEEQEEKERLILDKKQKQLEAEQRRKQQELEELEKLRRRERQKQQEDFFHSLKIGCLWTLGIIVFLFCTLICLIL